MPSLNPCSLSPLISPMYSPLFSDWRHTVSFKFFDTQAPSMPTEKLVLPRHARCVLSRLRCNGHSLLLSCYLSRIDRIENPFLQRLRTPVPVISFCTVQLRTLCAACSLATLCFSTISGPVSRLLGLHGLPPCPHSSERVG